MTAGHWTDNALILKSILEAIVKVRPENLHIWWMNKKFRQPTLYSRVSLLFVIAIMEKENSHSIENLHNKPFVFSEYQRFPLVDFMEKQWNACIWSFSVSQVCRTELELQEEMVKCIPITKKKKQSSFLNLTSRTGWDIVPSVSSHSVIVSTVKAKQLVQQSTCCGAGLKMLTETKPYQHCLWGGPVWTQSSGKSRWSSGRTSDWPGPTACTAHHCFLFPVSQHEKIKSLNVQGSFN